MVGFVDGRSSSGWEVGNTSFLVLFHLDRDQGLNATCSCNKLSKMNKTKLHDYPLVSILCT